MVGRSDLYMDFGAIELDGVGTSGKEGTNVLKMGKDRAKGCVLELRFPKSVEGSGTVNVKLQESDDGASFTDLTSTGAVNVSDLKAGTMLELPLGNHKAYLRLFAVPSNTLTGGEIRGELNTMR